MLLQFISYTGTPQTLSVNKMNNESAAEEGKGRGINRREIKGLTIYWCIRYQ
jgi:hypothetical protein